MASALPPQIFSRQRRIAGYRRALVRQNQAGAARFLLQDMVEDVLERLEFLRLEPKTALVVGDFTGTLALSLRGAGVEVVEADVCSFDEEAPLAGGPFDLIASLASLDRVNDLPGALLHMKNGLAAEGMMIASLPGAGSLPNLRAAMLGAEPDRVAPRMHPLVDNRAAAALLQRAGFARQVVDSRTVTVSYSSLDRLVADLRDQGLGNSLATPAPSLDRQALESARAAFSEAMNGNGRVLENFEVLTLTGWKS